MDKIKDLLCGYSVSPIAIGVVFSVVMFLGDLIWKMLP